MRPKAFPGDDGELYAKICEWIASDHVYTVRFSSFVLLMTYFLDGAFRPEYLSLAASVKSDEYYINTAIAWFFATAIAKQRKRDPIHRRMPPLPVGYNKSIQKAIESYRITPEDKAYLRTLRIKPGGVR